MEDQNFGWDDVGQLADQIFDGIGTNFVSRANNAQATADYNSAVAELVRTKARNETKKTEQYAKAINNIVIGLIGVLAIFVIAKYVLPKLK